MNVLLRSHEDAELSISAPSSRAPQDRVRYQLRRHSNCGSSSDFDLEKDKSRSRSCSPVRRLLQVTSQTWGSMKSTGSSSSSTRKSFSSILFANSKDNATNHSNSSRADDPVDPTEVDSLDFSHASSRSFLMGSQQGLSSSMKQLELAKEQDNNMEQEKQKQKKKGSSSQQQQQQSQRQTPSQEGSSSTSTTATSSAASSRSRSSAAVPFPPDGRKKRRSKRRKKRRKGARTRQNWEDLLEVHQRMTNTLPAATHEPLTAAVLHRRVLERKRLNARKLKLKIKFLEAPPETKVQSKLDKQPRRKSLPASPPKPAEEEANDKRKKRRMRRSSTADVDGTAVGDLTAMKKHLRRKADAHKKDEAAFTDAGHASAPSLRRRSSSRPLPANTSSSTKPNTPASPLPKKQHANPNPPTSSLKKNPSASKFNPAWRKNQKTASIPPSSPKSASTSKASNPASPLPKKPKATSNPPTSPKSASTSKPNPVSPSPKKKASTPPASPQKTSTNLIPTSSPPAARRRSSKTILPPSSPLKRAQRNKEKVSALSSSFNSSPKFYEEVPRCIRRGSLGIGTQEEPLNKPKVVPPVFEHKKKRDSLESTTTTTPRRLSRVERNSMRKEGISPKQLQELQKACLEAEQSEEKRPERNSITRKQEEQRARAAAPKKDGLTVDENTAPTRAAPKAPIMAPGSPAKVDLGYEDAGNDAAVTSPSRSLTPLGQRRTRRMTGLGSRRGLRRTHTADEDLVVKRPSFPCNDRRGSLHSSYPARPRRASRRPSFPCNGTRFSSSPPAAQPGESSKKDSYDRCLTR